MVATELCKYIETLNKGLHCINCGHKPTKGKPIYRGCPTSVVKSPFIFVCKHLAETTEVVLIKCQTCQGNVQIKYQSNICLLKGKCLPNYNPFDKTSYYNEYALCSLCPQKELVALTTCSTEL